MKMRIFIIGLFFIFFLSATAVYAQEGGSFSSYLVGTYDTMNGLTYLRIINPTAQHLAVYVVFLDQDGHWLNCKICQLNPNGLIAIDVKAEGVTAKYGVVKIVSMLEGRPAPGIVGFQRHVFPKSIVESNLAAVPGSIVAGELATIIGPCR